MAEFVFVSGNLHKVEYLERFLGRKVSHHKLDLTEVQSLDPLEVVRHKALEAYNILHEPVLIEDTSLKFAAWGRLPGPFIKFFLEEIGLEGICNLANGYKDKSATASVVYGYYDGKDFHSFGAEASGSISSEPRGNEGFGWDPIFIPSGQPKTYSEMSDDEVTLYSVRNKAVKKLKVFINEG